jgi:hypothetical protein
MSIEAPRRDAVRAHLGEAGADKGTPRRQNRPDMKKGEDTFVSIAFISITGPPRSRPALVEIGVQ